MVFPLFVSFYFTFPFHKKKAMPKIIHLALPFLVIAFLVIAFLEKRCFLKTFFLYFSYFVSISSFMSMNWRLLS
mgnify:FL=1